MGTSTQPRWRMIAVPALVAIVLAACSNTGSSSSPSANASAASSSSAAATEPPGVTAAKALVDKYKAVPAFQGPSETIDASALKGKTVWIIVNSLQNPFNTTIARAAQDALQKAGVGVKLVDGKGQLNEWTRQIEEAVAQKADAIIDSGVPTDLVQGPLKDVAAAGIPLIEAINDVNAPLFTGVKAHVALDFTVSGQLQAAYVIADSGGKASVLLYDDPEFVTTVGVITKSAQKYFADNCPDCKVTVKTEQIANVATSVPADTQSIIRANPDIKYVIANFDYLGGFVVQGLKQGGLSDVKVIGGDAVAQQLDQIRSGQSYVADVGATPIWCGWAATDEIMRLMLGKQAESEVIPFRIFTKDNLAAGDDPDALFQTDFRAPYLKLWGVSS